MKNIIIWGYGIWGVQLFRQLKSDCRYNIIGFADNSKSKQGKFVAGKKIYSFEEVADLVDKQDFEVIIASRAYDVIGRQLVDEGIKVGGLYLGHEIKEYHTLCWEDIDYDRRVDLYAGDICDEIHLANPNLYGLSISKSDAHHIFHDITVPYPIPDKCVDSYQAEDVLEHIEYDKLVSTINEIYRVLKPRAIFRITLPDYNSPYLKEISMCDEEGNLVFDATGGGDYDGGRVIKGGHVWFPTIDNVKKLLKKTSFENNKYLCYRDSDGLLHKEVIDFSIGHINRVNGKADDDIYSIVVDCIK